MVTPSSDTSVSNGVYVPGGIANGDMKPSLSTTPLADFLMQLEDYTPTVCYINICTLKFNWAYMFIVYSCLWNTQKKQGRGTDAPVTPL